MDFFFRISGDLLDKQKDTIHTTFKKKTETINITTTDPYNNT